MAYLLTVRLVEKILRLNSSYFSFKVIENTSYTFLIAFRLILGYFFVTNAYRFCRFYGSKSQIFRAKFFCDDVINDVITWCHWWGMHIIISRQHSVCLHNIFNAFYMKSKFKKRRKSIGAFEKHAHDLPYGSTILLKISEIKRKYTKIFKIRVTLTQKVESFRRC